MRNITLFVCSTFFLMACQQPADDAAPVLAPKTKVKITKVQQGTVQDNLALSATSLYLKRNIVSAPIAAYITKVNIHLGDQVAKGDILYVLESKERRALGNKASSIDPSLADFGVLKVLAQASGRVSTLDKQQAGDYVLEGMPLCTIAESNDLAFQINVPYEFNSYVSPGNACKIVLPDGSVHDALIATSLSNMNVSAQTQSFIAKLRQPLFLPENLIVKVLVAKGNEAEKQILPVSCVLSDEMMQRFWVMKLINDSTAVQVPVETGNKSKTAIEILSPQFSAADRIIAVGSYGLADTALVQVVNDDTHE